MNLLFNFIHPYGLIIGIGVLLGIVVVERLSKWFGKDVVWLDTALPWVIVGAVLGARVYHLVTDWQLYQGANFIDLVAIWRGGVGFLGAILGGLIGLVLAFRFKLEKIFISLDLIVFGIPVAQAIGRLGNYVNKELYGLPTNLPWGIEIKGSRYHPLFLYEAVLNLLLFSLLLLLARRKALSVGKGQYASIYLLGYALIRFWLEYLRVETARLSGVWSIFSTAQWVSLFMMVVAVGIFWTRRHAGKKAWDISLT